MAIIQRQEVNNIGKNVKKRELWYTECKLVQSLWKTIWWFLKKLKIELPCDPAILFLGFYLKEMEIGSQEISAFPCGRISFSFLLPLLTDTS